MIPFLMLDSLVILIGPQHRLSGFGVVLLCGSDNINAASRCQLHTGLLAMKEICGLQSTIGRCTDFLWKPVL